MVCSMTAFARREEDTEVGSMTWELRSVNHRYLEMNPRLPEELRTMEAVVRERIAARLGRGKVDVFFRFKPAAAAGLQLGLNEALVNELGRVLSGVNAALPGLTSTTALEILRWPGVVQMTETNQDAIQSKALVVLDEALTDLVQTRTREGEKLKQAVLLRSQGIRELVARAKDRLPEVLDSLRGRLLARFEDLKADLDGQRLEQEMVLSAQKMDVSEEMDRLLMHVNEVERVLNRAEPIGRRLDFLMQELNREANTLSSKSIDVETTRIAVDMKVLIEQMREQIQNIE